MTQAISAGKYITVAEYGRNIVESFKSAGFEYHGARYLNGKTTQVGYVAPQMILGCGVIGWVSTESRCVVFQFRDWEGGSDYYSSLGICEHGLRVFDGTEIPVDDMVPMIENWLYVAAGDAEPGDFLVPASNFTARSISAHRIAFDGGYVESNGYGVWDNSRMAWVSLNDFEVVSSDTTECERIIAPYSVRTLKAAQKACASGLYNNYQLVKYQQASA